MRRRDLLRAIGLGTAAVTIPKGLSLPPASKKNPGILPTLSESIASYMNSSSTALVQAEEPKKIASPPKLSFRKELHKEHKFLTFVSANFPDVPGCTCESWCYESELDFVDFRKLEDGKLELRHRVRSQPHVLIVTTATPQPGAVEFVARPVLDDRQDSEAHLPKKLPGLNMCFQLKNAETFCSQPDPYPEFVRRCFIFTGEGRTFLLQTHRRKILHRWPAEHRYNTPPWVQMYVGVWRPVPDVQGQGWAEYSTDRYTIPVIGAVSRDGQHLAAVANSSASMMAQAWHDCLHNNPMWTPEDAPPVKRRWRVKVYVVPNDPKSLLDQVAKDFPTAMKLQEKRVLP
ncbi:MAG: hypothetical protein ACYTEO_08105 [Planctomycetota bacterium]|jgi:hypothetical protein